MTIGNIAYDLGRFIDPKGHAKDDARRAQDAALARECPFCGAGPRTGCRTLTTGRPVGVHSSRMA